MDDEAREETLDPESWDEVRRLGHRMVDDMIAWTRSARERPPWQPVPSDVRARLRGPAPRRPEPRERVYEEFKRDVLPYPTGNVHPRFWGWVMGNGTVDGMLASMLAATMNCHVAGYDQSATHVEHQVLSWFVDALGLPAGTSGLFVSGGTLANLIGLVVARNTRAGGDVRAAGVRGLRPLAVYASVETHGWLARSCDLLGLGSNAVRRIPVDHRFQISTAALRGAIARDRAAGTIPLCVIGNAGTVNTGATDDLEALADLCRDEGIWFHVDGAFGALAALSPELRPLVRGIERADSLAFDLHKWGYVPYDAGCVLVRDAEAHRQAFSATAAYLAPLPGGIAAGPLHFADRGVELSRSFRALKVWMALKAQGLDAWGRLIRQNVAQAAYLAARVGETAALELLAPVPLNVVCFRHRAEGVTEAGRDAINRRILVELQERGIAVPSGTVLRDRFGLRVAITNHRSRREDFDALVEAVVRIGRELLGTAGGLRSRRRS